MVKKISFNFISGYKDKLGQKLAVFPIYLLYLYLSNNLFITLAALPLIFLLFNISANWKKRMLILCFLFDSKFSSLIITPFKIFSFNDYFFINHPNASSLLNLLSPLLIFTALVILFSLSWALSKLRNFKTYTTIVFFPLLIYLLIRLFSFSLNDNALLAFSLGFIVSVIAKKIWIVYLLALELGQNKKIEPLNILAGFALPGANFREHFSLQGYQSKETDDSFWAGIKYSFIFVVIIVIFSELTYTYYPFLKSGSFRITLPCRIDDFSVPINNLSLFRRSYLWGCFLQNEFGYGIIKHVLIDSMIFFIAPLMMGYRLSLPYRNFFKAKDWNNLMSRMFYFYSLIIYRIFIIEIHKLLLDLFKKRNTFFNPIATFLGVAIGGLIYHFVKDFIYILYFEKVAASGIYFSSKMQSYFLMTATLCALSTIDVVKKLFKGKVLLVIFLIVFLIGRSFYSSSRRDPNIKVNIENLKYLLGL